MKITTGRLGCAILAVYTLSLLGGDPDAAERKTAEAANKELVQDSRAKEREALRLSAVALQRFRRGCQPVVVSGTDKEAIHTPETVFVDHVTGLPLPAGTEICNGRAWTAVIQNGGTATDVAIATPQDSNNNQIADNLEAQEIFKQR